MAMEAWKQPQQTIMLSLYADILDAAISVEGFNELLMTRTKSYIHGLEKTWFASYLAVNPEDDNLEQKAMLWLNAKIVSATKTNAILSRSRFFYFISRMLRLMIRNHVVAMPLSNFQNQTIDTFFSVSDTWSEDQRKTHYFEKYQNYLKTFQGIAEANGLNSAIFIQPVPAINKPLSDEERQVVGGFDYKEDYLQQQGLLLQLQKQEGIKIYSLTDVYENVTESIYYDKINHSVNSPAYKLMAKAIVDTVASKWGLKKVE